MVRITPVRRVTQLVCFLVIVFGGFLLGPALDLSRGEIITEAGYSGSFERVQGIRWVQREKMAANAFLPLTSCYYQHRGMFSGCSLLFLSEHLTWLTPILHILPLLLLLLALMFVLGRLWCGWACPFGALSDVLSWIRKLVGRDHWLVPRRWRSALVWTKYVLLFGTLTLSVLAGMQVFANRRGSLFLPYCQMCLGKFVSPFLSFADICWSNWRDPVTGTLTVLGFAVLVVFFLGLAVRRFYCRICPIGGITAPFNRFGLVSLHKEAQKCTRCGVCARVCPVDNLTVFEGEQGQPVNACECTLCLRCVEACPERGCLEFTFLGRRVVGS